MQNSMFSSVGSLMWVSRCRSIASHEQEVRRPFLFWVPSRPISVLHLPTISHNRCKRADAHQYAPEPLMSSLDPSPGHAVSAPVWEWDARYFMPSPLCLQWCARLRQCPNTTPIFCFVFFALHVSSAFSSRLTLSLISSSLPATILDSSPPRDVPPPSHGVTVCPLSMLL